MKYKLSIFFIIGLTLYLIDIGLNSYDEKEIYISDQEIISLVTAWKSQVGRNPNDDEIARIINNLVEEEILYREALKLGLDREDRIIKRRLAQKISFLKQLPPKPGPTLRNLLPIRLSLPIARETSLTSAPVTSQRALIELIELSL